MELIKRGRDPCQIQFHQYPSEPEIMDLSDSFSSANSSPPPSQPKTAAKRGRPRLTEDAELAKQVSQNHR